MMNGAYIEIATSVARGEGSGSFAPGRGDVKPRKRQIGLFHRDDERKTIMRTAKGKHIGRTIDESPASIVR